MPASWRSAAGVAALIVLGACTNAGGAPSPAAPPAANAATYARLLQMTDERRLDTALVHDALRSSNPPLRAAAALAIGQVHGEAMAPVLRGLVADRDTAVAANAGFALGLLRDSAAVPALDSALHAGAGVAATAAWALGAIGTPAAPAIMRALAGQPRTPEPAGALLLAAARLRPVPWMSVRPYLASPRADIRWRAAYAGARSFDPAAVRDVLALAADPAPAVRKQVARILDHHAAGDSLGTPVRAALERLAADTNPHVRVEAIRSLASYGTDAGAIVLRAIHDPDANVRITAAQALARVLDAPRPTWMSAWRADTGFAYRRAVLISAMTHDVVLPAAEEDNPDGWLHVGDWRYRAAVADAGAAAPSIERLREVSLPATRDPDGRVREAGFAALAPHADTAEAHPWRRQYMYFALDDWDPEVRALGIESLIGHASAAELPRVLAAYKLTHGEHETDPRVAAVRYFVRAWRRDSTAFGDSLVAELRALPAPTDPLVRRAALGCSLFDAWRTAPAAPPRPLSWYEERVRALVLPALAGRRPHAVLRTARGPIELELAARQAPLTVDNFLTLARAGFYAHLAFHRVVPDFVVQDGDPRGDGNGGPPYAIRDELNRLPYDRGALGMALGGPDTGGSQYFITLSPQPHLDGAYTVFGHVVAGWAALDALVQGDSIVAVDVR